jgi:pimeloyl-ACP methyl ester carboxylesterase
MRWIRRTAQASVIGRCTGRAASLSDLGTKLPWNVPVHVFHGTADETVPPHHAELYARTIPQARIHVVPGRDHQLGDDLHEVAEVIRGLR